MSLSSVFEEEENNQVFLLALITSRKICDNLFGELIESEKGSRVCYQATFIADDSNLDRFPGKKISNATLTNRVAEVFINPQSKLVGGLRSDLVREIQSELEDDLSENSISMY